MPVEVPKRLADRLRDSGYEAGVLGLIQEVGKILDDNKMPFFPAFTDHGVDHINGVMKAAEKLVPRAVWDEPENLGSTDATVLVGAILLHDLALHIREQGFLALVGDSTRFRPLPWFDQNQAGRTADLPWPDLWRSFRKEVRYFSISQLDRVLGPENQGIPQIALGDTDKHPQSWTDSDRLMIGEFLRRHHARLAHEIAIYGFPGLDAKEFPVLSKTAPPTADAVGAVARSHGEDLRIGAAYLEHLDRGNLRPSGAAQVYLMGLLRIADYLQIDARRAPRLLLHLRDPQSPQSLSEWKKHEAIESISWQHKDPRAVTIRVSPTHDLSTHLQIGELLTDMQRELDLTTAVLSETYGSTDLASLQLRLQRVRTNIHDASLHERLTFVPRRARLRSAEDLFRLVVSDLYGKEPSVAGRELVQNAVDAVRERKGWHDRNPEAESPPSYDLPADVLVELRQHGDGMGELRVVDKGIGMTPSVAIDSFLTAGATFTPSIADEDELSPEARIAGMKAGRFGVGCFAAFLLGPEIQVSTRHVASPRGVTFTARTDENLVQLDWSDCLPVGTEIIVPFSFEDLPNSYRASEEDDDEKAQTLLQRISRLYELSRPSVVFRIRTPDDTVAPFEGFAAEVPTPGRRLPDDWRSIKVPNFDAILWQLPAPTPSLTTFSHWRGIWCRLAHNGIAIEKPSAIIDSAYKWADKTAREILARPSIAVFDTRDQLGVSLTRYELTEPSLSFEAHLLESIGLDVIAHALVGGPRPHPLAGDWGLQPVVSRKIWIPFLPALVDRFVDRDLCVMWISNPEGQAPAKRFVSGRLSGGHWRKLPFRVALAPKEIHDAVNSEERNQFGFSELELSKSVRKFGELIGRTSIAEVVCEAGEARVALGSEAAETEGLLDLLIQITHDIAEDVWPETIAFTVFRSGDAPVPPRSEAIANAWVDLVGDGIARNAVDRQTRRASLTDNNRSLRTLVSKWERLERAAHKVGMTSYRNNQLR